MSDSEKTSFLADNAELFKGPEGQKLLAAIERSDTEQLQISISEYRGKSYLNMRIFYTTDDGQTWLPTKKGVTFTPEQIDMLEEAIQEAKKEFMEEE